MDASGGQLDALVVLGCKVHAGEPSEALLRRLQHACTVQRSQAVPLVIMSGGMTWGQHREAEVMARWWHAESMRSELAQAELVLEIRSRTTRENASCVSKLLRERKLSRVGLVTCDFHMKRASALFRRQGLSIVPLAAVADRTFGQRLRLWLREQAAALLGIFERRSA